MLFEDLMLEELSGNDRFDIVATFGGRFHPPHKGHKSAYDYMVSEFEPKGGDVYITTSSKVDPPGSPFTFEDKQLLFKAIGVNPRRVVNVRNNYNPIEITNSYDPSSTILIVGVSEKDMEGDPRFTFKPKRDGSPAYLQKYEDIEMCTTMDKHGYVFTVPTIEFDIGNGSISSATQIRKSFIDGDEESRIKLLHELYPAYNPEIYNIFETALLQ